MIVELDGPARSERRLFDKRGHDLCRPAHGATKIEVAQTRRSKRGGDMAGAGRIGGLSAPLAQCVRPKLLRGRRR